MQLLPFCLFNQWFAPDARLVRVRTFTDHRDSVRSACATPDSRYLITCSMDCTIKKWDLRGYVRQVATTEDFASYVWSVCSNSSGIYAVTWLGTVAKLDFNLKFLVSEKPIGPHRPASGCEHVIRCTETRVATASYQPDLPGVHIFDADLKLVSAIDFPAGLTFRVSSLWLTNERIYLWTTSDDGTNITTWDLKTLARSHVIKRSATYRIIARDGRLYCNIMGTNKRKEEALGIYLENSWKEVEAPTSATLIAEALDVFGPFVAGSGGANSVVVWNSITGNTIRTAPQEGGHSRGVNCALFLGQYLVTSSSDKTAILWQVVATT